jgi:hypothetical protein
MYMKKIIEPTMRYARIINSYAQRNSLHRREHKEEIIKKKVDITDDNFWIVRVGYQECCSLLSIPEIKFARILEELKSKHKK